ncbi:MAG: hypothetical protein EHM14_15850 [Methanothrix sp.]|nr:MAG: hypothetical protein EHM14_15850 [Methanothrix sp.]
MIDIKNISKNFKQLAICGISNHILQIRTGSYVLNIKNCEYSDGLLDVKLLKKGILTRKGKFDLLTPIVDEVKPLDILSAFEMPFKGIAALPYDYIIFNEGLALGTNGRIGLWVETGIEEKFGVPLDAFDVLSDLGGKPTFMLTKNLSVDKDALFLIVDSFFYQMYIKLYRNVPDIKDKLPIRDNFVYINRKELLPFFKGLLVYICEDKPDVTIHITDKILHVNNDSQEIETPKGFEHFNLTLNVLNIVKVLTAMQEPVCVSVPSDSKGPIVFRTKTMFDEYFSLVMPIV